MYREVTREFQIDVEPLYVPERSNTKIGSYFFAYRIRITNLGKVPARLVSRHWLITDGNGHVEHVQGPGVVGETPRLEHGQEFEYTSFCPLPTPTGNMRGTYQMVTDEGDEFEIKIPLFFLRREDSELLH